MKTKISFTLNIALIAIICASFVGKGALVKDYAGTCLIYVHQSKNLKGFKLTVDSIKPFNNDGKPMIEFEFPYGEMVSGETEMLPVKFIFIKKEGKNQKIIPITATDSEIAFDFKNESKEETLKNVKKIAASDSSTFEATDKAEFLSDEMLKSLFTRN
jgi:hypothetical protein